MKEVMVDYLIFAGHKALLGPIGIGGIVMHVNDRHILLQYTGVLAMTPKIPLCQKNFRQGWKQGA